MSTDRLSPDDNARWLADELREIDANLTALASTLVENQREQTAATLLAALMTRGRSLDSQHAPATVRDAVALTDALRAALKGDGNG